MLSRPAPRWIIGAFLACAWACASAQLDRETLGPGDEFEREIEARIRADSALAPALIEDAAQRRAERDELPLPLARAVVHCKLGLLAMERKEWKHADIQFGAAYGLAGKLEDAGFVIDALCLRAQARLRAGERAGALADTEEAWLLAKQIGDAPRQVRAGFALADLRNAVGRPQLADPLFEEMLLLPGVDRLAIEVRRAELAGNLSREFAEPHWRTVVEHARTRGDAEILARALDELASCVYERKYWAEVLALYRESESLGARRARGPVAWFQYSKALSATGDYVGARAALERAVAVVDVAESPRVAADIEDARATVLAELGEHAAAYAAVRQAQRHRDEAANSGIRMKAVRLMPPTPTVSTEQASALAAARAALREAELERARAERRTTAGIASAVAILAVALGIAYYYKRRAAAALALAKDAAELRAERTHWQMLRYQLNPHFLYNSLASLSGLIVVDPAAARTFVGRLSDFCRLALQRADGDLRTIDDEVKFLEAFLDIEQAGADCQLRARFEVDPDARPCRIPPLLLQPLVENALKYGDATTTAHREIVVAARREDGKLSLEVANSGQWAPEGARASHRRGKSGLGLANVRERLARLGSGASLDVDSSEAGWVRVRVTLPVLAQEALPAGKT